MYTDTSNSYFTIAPVAITSTITVTSPNGGESWQRGTSHTVTWSYTGSPGSNVQITLLKAGTAVGTISASTSIGSGGIGSYTWPIYATGATGSDYSVKVTSMSNALVNDTSNNYFTLASSGNLFHDHRYVTEWRGVMAAGNFSYRDLELHRQSRVECEDYPAESRYGSWHDQRQYIHRQRWNGFVYLADLCNWEQPVPITR